MGSADYLRRRYQELIYFLDLGKQLNWGHLSMRDIESKLGLVIAEYKDLTGIQLEPWSNK